MQFLLAIPLGILLVVAFFIMINLRVVVSTNDVHIVQSARKTVSYGRGQTAGNVYYAWPAWLPSIGVRVTTLPVSVFSTRLDDYPGYDKGRVPFMIDILAFFRVSDSNMAAERVQSFKELMDQLKGILQGAIRAILASSEIEEILEGRAKFGEMFTKEVDHQLEQWGVQTVKSIELMDIRDAQASQVIANIMAKKKSLIERESRVAVAANMQAAQTAEIEAKQAVAVRDVQAQEQVGVRAAQKEQQVGLSQQQAAQVVKEAAKVTAEKEMAVTQVQRVRAAEIERDVQVVAADQAKKVAVIQAEGDKQAKIIDAEAEQANLTLVAEGNLQRQLKQAQGTQAEGEARGIAERALQLAPVQAQITLAKEIGQNEGYQTYLIGIRRIEASQAIGIAQAGALAKADIKIIANSGDPVGGIGNVMDLMTPKGGTQIGSMLEGLRNTPVGEAILKAAGVHEGPRANGAG